MSETTDRSGEITVGVLSTDSYSYDLEKVEITLGLPDTITVGELKSKIIAEIDIPEEEANYWNRDSLRLSLPRDYPYDDLELVPDNALFMRDHVQKNLPQLKKLDGSKAKTGVYIHYRFDKFFQIEGVRNPFDADEEENQYDFLSGMEWHYQADVKSKPSVGYLKEWIKEQTNIPIEALHILWDGSELAENWQSLAEEVPDRGKIPNGSVLQIWASKRLVHVMSLQLPLFACGSEHVLEKAASYVMEEGEAAEEYIMLLQNGVCVDLGSATAPSCPNNGIVYLIQKRHLQPLEAPADHRVTIKDPELRGLSVKQMKDLATNVILRCVPDGWTSTNPTLKGKKLVPEEVTLYDLMEHFVRPITTERKCSFVEYVSTPTKDQTPNFFVSHWWGESVLRFVACVLQHAQDRKLPEDTTYWICAYSLDQHHLEDEMGNSLETIPFFKAIQHTEGTLSVLDGNATCYERLWCAFEISIVFQHMKEKSSPFWKDNYAYGMYSMSKKDDGHPGHPVGLTDGLVPTDDGNQHSKSTRQSSFPVAISSKALSVELQNANVSVSSDRAFILNAIVGQNGSDLPPEAHEAYDALNAAVRARFAEATYSLALKNKLDIQLFRNALQEAPFAQLTLDFFECQEFIEEAKHLNASLPLHLVQLELVIGGIEFQTDEQFASGIGQLVRLQTLKLNAGNGWGGTFQISNIDHLCAELKHLHELRDLHLNFNSASHLQSIYGFGEAISSMPKLHSFALDLRHTGLNDGTAAENAALEIAKALQAPVGLRNLCLQGVPFSSHLSSAIARLNMLATLQVQPSTISQTDSDRLWIGISEMASLEELSVIVRTPGLEVFAGSLHKTAELRKLELTSFQAASASMAVLEEPMATTNFKQLEELTLDLKDSSSTRAPFSLLTPEVLPKLKLCNITILGGALESLGGLEQNLQGHCFPHLEELSIICDCCGSMVVNDIVISKANMPTLKNLLLCFSGGVTVRSVAGLQKGFQRSKDWNLSMGFLAFQDAVGVSDEDLVLLAKSVVDSPGCTDRCCFQLVDGTYMSSRREVLAEAARRALL